ncbi:hypothetical protein J1614_011714 [Plenodomus biglobosus]|nr:hypothetical protein J1614_011714 [Plenodomus biglobosus]
MLKPERPPITEAEIRKLIPPWIYDNVPDMFNPVMAGELPPRRPGIDHAIITNLGEVSRPRIYGLTRTETEALKAYIDDMMGRGFIRPSTSPYAALVLVVKKPGGGPRICVDY